MTVPNNLDSGKGSLRTEIKAASNGDTIVFAPGLSGQIITLTKSDLEIDENLTIAGPGAGKLAISGNQSVRVFEVDSGTQVNLDGLTIGNGLADAVGGILNNAALTISNCTLSDNTASKVDKEHHIVDSEGDGVENLGTLAVNNCILSGNVAASSFGGGIDNEGGMRSVNNSTLSNNTGSAICNDATATISGSGLSDNSAFSGAGVFNIEGTLTINACTISHNTAQYYGGGIYTEDGKTVTVSGSTQIDNTGYDSGGGIYDQGSIAGGALIVTSTTLSGNFSLYGAGFWIDHCTLAIGDSAVSGNSSSFEGDGIYLDYDSTSTLSNCQVWGNSAFYVGGGIWLGSSTAMATIENGSSITGNSAPAEVRRRRLQQRRAVSGQQQRDRRPRWQFPQADLILPRSVASHRARPGGNPHADSSEPDHSQSFSEMNHHVA